MLDSRFRQPTLFTITYNDARGAASRIVLVEGETIIGRATNATIVVNVPSVSRQHARLRVANGICTLSDAGSTYGTQLNGVPIKGDVPLKSGDAFQCGDVIFTVERAVEPGVLLTDENHQLLQDSASIVMRIDSFDAQPKAEAGTTAAGVAIPMARPAVGPPAPRPVTGGAATPPVSLPTPVPAAGRQDSRKGTDRRKAQIPFAGSERRARRDRRQLRFVRLLSEISKTLVDVLPLSQVLSRVVDLVFEVIPAERTFLLLRDSADAAVTARVLRARDGSTPGASLSRTIVTKVMRERVAMLADDARYDSRLDGAGSIQAMDIRSFMCAPLWNRNDVIGVLYTDNPKSKRFVPEDLDVFAALANYAAVAIEQARVAEQLQKEMQKRERLQRYHSPAVVNKIISGTLSADAAFEAQERDVTVMFTDLVGFTARSEHMTPLEVAKMLNYFFTQMAEHIFEVDGTLDKFIGDGLLAVFGAPLPQEDHADRAVEAALAMRQALKEINKEWPEAPLRMRIALNSGFGMTGDIGSPRRREFTVLGDVVNACSRIESTVCKPDQIVCSRATLDRAKKPFNATSLGMVSLRGRRAEIEVFEIN
jgi:adenylate cyclase